LRLILSLLVVAATVQGVVTFYEYARHANLNLYTSEVNQAVSQTYYFNFGTQFRPAGLLPDPDSLGNILALALPLAFVLALGASTRMARFAWVACAAVIAVALTLSFSRASWIGAAAGIVLALIALPPRGRARGLLGASVLLVVTVVIGLAIGGGSLTERFASIENPTARTVRTAQGDEERKRVWSAALAIASAHPVVGVGMGRLQEHLSEHLGGAHEGVHAQSVYLQFLAQSGAVGLLALLLLVGHAATGVWRGFRSERLFMAGVGGAVVAMLIGWTTDTTARYTCVSVVLAFLLGAAMAQHWTTENDATPLGT
jgi:O-antigen ligase